MVSAHRAARVSLGRVRRPLLEGRPVGGTRWEHGHGGVTEATRLFRGRSTGLRPVPFRAYCRRTRVGSLLGFARGRRHQVLLSLPTACRPTPIGTTRLYFNVCLKVDGVMEVML